MGYRLRTALESWRLSLGAVALGVLVAMFACLPKCCHDSEDVLDPATESFEGVPVGKLLELLKRGDDEEREYAALSLGYVFKRFPSDPKVCGLRNPTSIEELLQDIEAVRQKGVTPRASELVKVLLESIDDGCAGVRRATCYSLMVMGPNAVAAEAALRAALKDPDGRVRCWAARALYWIVHDVTCAVHESVKLLGDEDAEVRRLACGSLGLMMGDDATPALPILEKHLVDEDSSVRVVAGIAIHWIRGYARVRN